MYSHRYQHAATTNWPRAVTYVALTVACIGLASPVRALQWEQLGPTGGEITSIAADPNQPGLLYGLSATTRIYASFDNGLHWTEQISPPNCNGAGGFFSSEGPLQVRNDGEVFLHCTYPILRSGDQARSWRPYYPDDYQLAFDLSSTARAVLANEAVTFNDGGTWISIRQDVQNPLRRLIAFDPVHPGRLAGIGTEDRTNYYESSDYGAHWSTVSNVVPFHGNEMPCWYERAFIIDALGRMFVVHDCGFFRSVDGGGTWQQLPGFPGTFRLPRIVADPRQDRLFIVDIESTPPKLYESRDAGLSWQTPPAPPKPPLRLALDATGAVWVATTDGIYVFDTSTETWLERNVGVYGHPIATIVPSSAGGLVLSTVGNGGNLQSLDGGGGWVPYSLAGKPAAQLARNVNVPGSLLALTEETTHELHTSSDGGATWRLVTSNPVTDSGQLVTGLVPVGQQPGLVYGLHETCVASGFVGCFWTPHGAAKSVDGGMTWVTMDNGLSSNVTQLVVSPVDSNTAFAFGPYGANLYVTRDGAQHWSTFGAIAYSVVPDSFDAARFYVEDVFGNLAVSPDYGRTLTAVSRPPVLSKLFDLLADPNDARILYAIGTTGEIAMSKDRAANWQTIVEASATLMLYPNSAKILSGGSPSIYAGSVQGVLRVIVQPPESAIPTLGRASIALLSIMFMVLTVTARSVRRIVIPKRV